MLKNYLNQNITIYANTGNNEYGEPSFGSGVSVKARFENESDLIKDDSGEDVNSTARLWVLPAVTINKGDKVVFENSNYRVMKVYTGFRRTKTSHKKVYLQLWQIA